MSPSWSAHSESPVTSRSKPACVRMPMLLWTDSGGADINRNVAANILRMLQSLTPFGRPLSFQLGPLVFHASDQCALIFNNIY